MLDHRLPLHRLNDYGWFKPSRWFYLCCLWLSRTWLLLVFASASRSSGSDLLALFYPNQTLFYLGLISGLPAILILWLQSMRHRYRWLWPQWRWGYGVMLLSVCIDISIQCYQLISLPIGLSMTPAILLLGNVWCGWYLYKSPSSRLIFTHQGDWQSSPKK